MRKGKSKCRAFCREGRDGREGSRDIAILGDDDSQQVGCCQGRQMQATPGPQPSRVSDRHFFMDLHGASWWIALLHIQQRVRGTNNNLDKESIYVPSIYIL